MPNKKILDKDIITNPTKEQLFTGGGIFIMNQTVECDNIVSSVNYFGFLNIDEYFEVQDVTDYIVGLYHIRSSGSEFNIINTEFLLAGEVDEEIDRTDPSQNLINRTFNLSSTWMVKKGDQFAVLVPSQCVVGFCPIQVGLVNVGCDYEDISLFEPQFFWDALKTSISKNQTTPVAVKINVNFGE